MLFTKKNSIHFVTKKKKKRLVVSSFCITIGQYYWTFPFFQRDRFQACYLYNVLYLPFHVFIRMKMFIETLRSSSEKKTSSNHINEHGFILALKIASKSKPICHFFYVRHVSKSLHEMGYDFKCVRNKTHSST